MSPHPDDCTCSWCEDRADVLAWDVAHENHDERDEYEPNPYDGTWSEL